MKQFDVVALGELLIDFTENGISDQGNPVLEANPGGAPCNVLAMLSRLGKRTAFIGKVGEDTFGRQLANIVQQCGINTSDLIFDQTVHTTLAFVHTLLDGEREFSFYRNPGADVMLRREEIDINLLRNTKIFHFGTLSSTHPDVREATRFAVETAKKSGAWISFDPNLREPLWEDLEDARREIAYGLSQCDILKISDNEVEFMTGTTDFEKGAQMLRGEYPNIKVLFLTLGKNGSSVYYKDMKAYMPTFTRIKPVEKTGAGDTFEGCALNYTLEHDMETWTHRDLENLLTFANAGASLITTRKGALKVMPTQAEIQALIGET